MIAPKKAPNTAVIPKESSTLLSMKFLININFNALFRMCTMAVANTANSIGIKRLNTDKRSVPNPNPEKKVNIDAKNETTQMSKKKNISSINRIFNKNK
mgnify:CR=1 FL=1